jgi:hypothetical protein
VSKDTVNDSIWVGICNEGGYFKLRWQFSSDQEGDIEEELYFKDMESEIIDNFDFLDGKYIVNLNLLSQQEEGLTFLLTTVHERTNQLRNIILTFTLDSESQQFILSTQTELNTLENGKY